MQPDSCTDCTGLDIARSSPRTTSRRPHRSPPHQNQHSIGLSLVVVIVPVLGVPARARVTEHAALARCPSRICARASRFRGV